jgi:hypothetical protein
MIGASPLKPDYRRWRDHLGALGKAGKGQKVSPHKWQGSIRRHILSISLESDERLESETRHECTVPGIGP